MITDYVSPTTLVYAAGVLQILGYLIINQVILRMTLVVSTSFYILYYFTVGPEPLWAPMTLSGLTIVAILLGLAGLFARNARWALPARDRDLAPYFPQLQPGDLRLLLRRARRYTLHQETIVTEQGVRPDKVYFVLSGDFRVTKGAASFSMYGPTFVGEVAYLSGNPSVATTVLPAGIEVIEWRLDDLAQQSRRKPRFKLALDAVISHDLARKVALAVAPSDVSQAPPAQKQAR